MRSLFVVCCLPLLPFVSLFVSFALGCYALSPDFAVVGLPLRCVRSAPLIALLVAFADVDAVPR